VINKRRIAFAIHPSPHIHGCLPLQIWGQCSGVSIRKLVLENNDTFLVFVKNPLQLDTLLEPQQLSRKELAVALYFLDYDLRKTRDYARLYAELRNFAAVRVLESTWCFNRLNTTSTGLRDHFRQFIDADDGLCIMEVTDWATYKCQGSPNDLR